MKVAKMLKLLIIAIPSLIIIFGFFYGFLTRIKLIRVQLPEASGFRIAAASDFHLAVGRIGVYQAINCLKLAIRCEPDAVLLLGDIVSGKGGISHIKLVFSRINVPIYAVPGNHDHWAGLAAVSKALEDVGVKLLINDSVVLKKGNREIAIVGIDDIWSGKPDWERAFANISEDIPIILLSHNPDAALHPCHNRVSLILSGHTHGGFWLMPFQIRQLIWRITGIKFIPRTEYGWRFPYGLRKVGDTFVYITSGVTKGHVIPRWFTKPEIVVIEFY